MEKKSVTLVEPEEDLQKVRLHVKKGHKKSNTKQRARDCKKKTERGLEELAFCAALLSLALNMQLMVY